jgi:tricorn protease
VFSPDGKLIAFSANYDGNTDVYVIPSSGGTPKRLTYHPDPDIVQGFTPDGKSVLFASGRSSYTNRYSQLFTVSIEGGPETKLPIPNAARASYSPDGSGSPTTRSRRDSSNGSTIAAARRRSSGCTTSRRTPSRRFRSPKDARTTSTRSGSATPVYFRSDRDGEFNVYAYDAGTKKGSPPHDARGLPRSEHERGAGKLIYEQAGYLHVLEPTANGNGRKLVIGVAADLRETRPRFVKGANYARNLSLSPSGVRAAFEYRGEIVTVPVEKGDARNLTNTPGANERSPAWSPDGSQIAYVSDESGEYELKIAPQDGHGAVKTLKLMGHGFYQDLDWSPDGTHIAVRRQLDEHLRHRREDRGGEDSREQQGVRTGRPRRHDARLVARLQVARLHGEHQIARHRALGVQRRRGQVVSSDGRVERGEHARVRQEWPVPLHLRVDRCRSAPGLVLARDRRLPAHPQHLRDRPAQRRRESARERKR